VHEQGVYPARRGKRRRGAKLNNTVLYFLIGVVVFALLLIVVLGVFLMLPPPDLQPKRTARKQPPNNTSPNSPIEPVKPPVAPANPEAPLKPAEPPRPAENIFTVIENAVRKGMTTKTQGLGGGFRDFLEVPEEGALLTGLEVGIGKWNTQDVIHSLRPIYQSSRGRFLGALRGRKQDRVVTLEANAGYAVGGLTVRSGAGLDALAITFMAIEGKTLNPAKSYQSERVGGFGGNEHSLAGDGIPVVGIFGKLHATDDVTNGLGLVLLGR
jgi:hypothetical protein